MFISIEEKYGIIRERDELFAFELAKLIIEKPKVPLWIIFLPLLFVFYAHWLQKYKKNINTFATQYLHAKILALDTALEESAGGTPREENQIQRTVAPIDEHSDRITDYESLEIDILREHYRLLLSSPGQTYPDLLRNAYQTSGEYRFFLNRLIKTEEEINRSILQLHHPTVEAREVVEQMETFSERLREIELAQIFG
jgi:hypothetical protein